MSSRNVYISSHDPALAEEAAAKIRAAGHTVVSTCEDDE